MLPLDLQASLGSTGTILVQLLLGFAFGFVLESAGFADSRKLARQFYFQEMTVLKVMFGAIVVAMLVIGWGVATGVVDFGRIFVNPTYWKSGMLGGLILGMGFIIGGFCPGTAWVGMATGKVDAMFFIGGVFIGIFAFGETVPRFWDFFNEGGVRLTLGDWLDIPMSVVVLAVTVIAIGAFWASERAEIANGSRRIKTALEPAGPKGVAAVVLVILAGTLFLRGDPTLEKQLAWRAEDQAAVLQSRELHVDPAEVLDLMHNNQMRLVLMDARSEGDYNRFHLRDAHWLPLEHAEAQWVRELHPESVIVVMSNGEDRAEELWRRLNAQGAGNLYVLAGGVQEWVKIYGPGLHRSTAALGDRLPLARPALEELEVREYTPVVKMPRPVSNLGGGCG